MPADILVNKKTMAGQELKIFNTHAQGMVMTLDGCIQITEGDEMSYQEMLAQVPMHSVPNPERVLIIGGGDGGMLREVCKHTSVKHVTMVINDDYLFFMIFYTLRQRVLGACFPRPKRAAEARG